MNTEPKTSTKVISFIVATCIALYILFPFYLVVVNACKAPMYITESPVSMNGVSI